MQRDRLEAWVELYERLWRTPGTAGLGTAFAPRVVYSMGPYEQPVEGLEALADLWEKERHSAKEAFELDTEIVAAEGATAVVRAEVRYGPPREQEYKDLWVVEFDDQGCCVSFEEWPFWPEQSPLAAEPG